MAKTLYALLEVPHNAAAETIKEAYVKHAARLRSSGAEGELAAVKQAYEILSDPAMRARYDRQPYLVAESAGAGAGERSWLLSWRGVVLLAGIALIGLAVWTYHKREQQRIRLEHERIEALRKEEEERRVAEERRRDAELKQAEEQRRENAEHAAAIRASQQKHSATLYRERLDRAQEMQRERLRLQSERAADRRAELERRREDAERLRLEREHQRQLEIERRQVQELERTSPRRF